MIRRAEHRHHYVQVDNRAVEDARLSLRAKGLLVYLLSRPPNWCAQPTQVAKTTTDSVGIVRRCLQELRRHGYATLQQKRSSDGTRAAGTEWLIDELPAEMPKSRDSAFPSFSFSPPLTRTVKTNNTEKKTSAPWALPLDLAALQPEWDAWLKYKRQRRNPMVETTFTRQIAKLQRLGVEAGRTALATAMERGWTGFFEEKLPPGAAPPLNLATKTYAQLQDMIVERHGKQNTLNRNYGVNAPGAIARQRKQLTAELAQLFAASKEARKREGI